MTKKLLLPIALVAGTLVAAGPAQGAPVRECGNYAGRYFKFVNLTTRSELCVGARSVARAWERRYRRPGTMSVLWTRCRTRFSGHNLDVRCVDPYHPSAVIHFQVLNPD